MRRPLLSFIIPAYNAENYLDACVTAVLRDVLAENVSSEILIVENGSTDNTTQKANDLAQENPERVRVLHSEKGLPCARNAGIHAAQGLYVVFVDADDLWLPGSAGVIRRMIHRFHADLYAFGYETDAFVQDHGMKGRIAVADTPEKVEKRRAWMISRPMSRTQAWAKVYKSEMILGSGQFFDETMNFCEDGEYIVRVTGYCRSIVVCGHPIYHYRYSAGSMMRGYDEGRIEAYVRAMKTSEALMDGESERIRKAFLEYVLCHLNLLLVRNVYSRQIRISGRDREKKMKELCGIPIFREALQEIGIESCLSRQLLPELFLKSHLPLAAQALCAAKAWQNSRREQKANEDERI